jgi:N utilization substance protein B
MTTPATSRRQARRDAMVVLYQHDITGAGLDDLYQGLEKETGHPPDAFTREEVDAVMGGRDSLDAVIDATSEGWPAHRMAALERNILRLAVYEITRRDDIPLEVSIDEAVALAKRFCSREAGTLVNGILGKIAEEARKHE